MCGRRIKVKNTGHWVDKSIGGKGNIIYPIIVDTCVGCQKAPGAHLDLSVGAWNKLTNGAQFSNVAISW